MFRSDNRALKEEEVMIVAAALSGFISPWKLICLYAITRLNVSPME